MRKLEEKDFIKGDKEEFCEALLISEDCNAYIDSVLDKIYELDLTSQEEKDLGIEIHGDNSWKRVKLILGPGSVVIFSRQESKFVDRIYKTSHELTCRGQLDTDKKLGIMTGFGVVTSHDLFSYRETWEKLNFDLGEEKSIRIGDEVNLTEYGKLGLTKKPVFNSDYGFYTQEYLDYDSFKEEHRNIDGKYQNVYFDLEGKPLTQSEFVATSYDSFDEAFTSFEDKYKLCRELVDSRLQEIINKKKQLNK